MKDLYAFHDGEAREVMPLSREVVNVSIMAFLKLQRLRKVCSEGAIVGLIETPRGRCCEGGMWSYTLR